jgi:predicted nucleic acid-binding protein
MTTPLCPDSNLFLKLWIEEPDSEAVQRLIAGWINDDRVLVAPSLFAYEVTSVLRSAAHRQRITAEDASRGLIEFRALDVQLLRPPGLHDRALALATEFQRPNAYDTHYMAIAEELDCEFWTADERLYNAVREGFPLIRLAANA